MQAAPSQAQTIDQARMYRDGLLITLLAHRPRALDTTLELRLCLLLLFFLEYFSKEGHEITTPF